MNNSGPEPSSFRDPAGFVFLHDGNVYRRVNESHRENFLSLIDSGLYRELSGAGLLIEHEEVSLDHELTRGAFRVLKPRPVPFISYPYEWSASQLQRAALCTIEIALRALEKDLILSDASAYNVQFFGGRPMLIDTLSFIRYREGEPWTAYRQFCQHFLAPLALMCRLDLQLGQLLRAFLDGIPLPLASKLLPLGSFLQPSLLLHLHMHARAQAPASTSAAAHPGGRLSRKRLRDLLESLRAPLLKCRVKPSRSVWSNYYEETNYSSPAMHWKEEAVDRLCSEIRPLQVLDLGSNTGRFSEIAARHGGYALACDSDPMVVELAARRFENSSAILPLLIDLANPSPSQGWASLERTSFADRSRADLVLALALVHHLAIGNNLPFDRIARFFSRLAPRLAIEFVPKEDSQVQRLLASRADIFPDYHEESFIRTFSRYYIIEYRRPIPSTVRTLFVLKRLGCGS